MTDAPRTVTGTLRRGFLIQGERHRDFELREATAGDLFEAEKEAAPNAPLAFAAALLVRQLVRVGSYEGVVTPAMIAQLTTTDFAILREKQLELEALGEVG